MDAIALLQEVSRRDGVGGRVLGALEEAARLIGAGAEALDDEILAACSGTQPGVADPCRHVIEAGGKRIRPMLCLLAFRAARGGGQLPLDLAVTCELLHDATLLHDDVIDEGEVRRGRPSACVVYGNAIAVLGGDYLLVRTVEMVSARGPRFMDRYLVTLHDLIGGELMQLKRRGSVDTTEEEYFSIVRGKTASLFRWAAESGALAAGAADGVCRCLGELGWHAGIAFQIMDDVLDFAADPFRLGKTLLADVREGKMTLPLILARRGSPAVGELLVRLRDGADPVSLAPRIAAFVHSTGALAEARARAARHTSLSIEALGSVGGGALDPEAVRVLEVLSRALLERES